MSDWTLNESLERAREAALLVDRLHPRQREVLEKIAGEKITKVIAYEMGISIKTVEVHRAAVMDKLGASNLAGLARIWTLAQVLPALEEISRVARPWTSPTAKTSSVPSFGVMPPVANA